MKRAGWDDWFARLQHKPQHGATLIDAMVNAAAGRYCTGPSDADDALKEAERDGLIARTGWDPTHSQRAFLGLTYRSGKLDDRTKEFHASCWWWQPA